MGRYEKSCAPLSQNRGTAAASCNPCEKNIRSTSVLNSTATLETKNLIIG